MTIEDLYHRAWRTPGNIHEHCPTLRALASILPRVVELGTNQAVSTTALLAGRPKSLTTWDLHESREANALAEYAGRTDYRVRQGDSRLIDIDECDLLFIDTLHTREQLSIELARHSPQVTTAIVLHDTTTFGATGEDGTLGLRPAIDEFIARGDWRIEADWPGCNGLMMLRRR